MGDGSDGHIQNATIPEQKQRKSPLVPAVGAMTAAAAD
jgi:hypothetical protein